jgi:hypothetical protein
MIITNEDKLRQFLIGPDFLSNNSGYDFEHHHIRVTKKLVYDHHATVLPVVRLKAKGKVIQIDDKGRDGGPILVQSHDEGGI